VATEDLTTFTARVEEFFSSHCPRASAPTGWGNGDDAIVASGLAPGRHETGDLEASRTFQRELFDAGLAWLTGPSTYGGAELDDERITIIRDVRRNYEIPDTSVFMIGQQIVAPAILAFGSEDQKRRWLKAIFRGDSIGCQIFSEPDSGSDLASVRCRAEPDGDGWTITGQKVWSSGAHLAEVGELLTRTESDPDLRHKGLTMFLVDMSSPGVTVRPLRQMNGNSHFNEVFFEGVHVPAEAMLGPRAGGWAVANASLTSERDLAADDAGLFLQPVDRLVDLSSRLGATSDPLIRQELAATVTARHISDLLPDHLSRNSGPGSRVAASLAKFQGSQSLWDLAQGVGPILGPSLVADDGEWGHYAWSGMTLGVHSQRIAGGTDEIQHNIIAERGLGLPRDLRPDRKETS
jgi:alkylation response protein AidB-like acyl-CoA dehydrogenase